MKSHLTARINIGNAKYKVEIAEKGGQVLVYRNRELTFNGQWFPEEDNLVLFNCPFENIREKLEELITSCDGIDNIIFPYLSEKYL